MSKEIILVRHGKAADHNTYKRDIDRVLTERGVSDGYKIAEELSAKGVLPDLIITSPAARASHTALIISRVLKRNTDNTKIESLLYHCSADVFLEVIYSLPEDINSVMIVAHNPGVTDLAFELTKGGTSFLPTTGVAIIRYNVDTWQNIHSVNADNFLILKPKELS